jgi:hypothetical protein
MGIGQKLQTPSAPMATPGMTTPKPTTEPAPMILHEDTNLKSLQSSSNFRLPRPGEGAEMKMPEGKGTLPLRNAVLELGKNPAPAASQQTPNVNGSKVVHYTEFKASLAEVPTANGGARNVTEITTPTPMATRATSAPISSAPTKPSFTSIPVPQAPKPSMPLSIPKPPQAPRPPQVPPPAPPQSKVIKKDYV